MSHIPYNIKILSGGVPTQVYKIYAMKRPLKFDIEWKIKSFHMGPFWNIANAKWDIMVPKDGEFNSKTFGIWNTLS
jgi:hypothetical protein